MPQRQSTNTCQLVGECVHMAYMSPDSTQVQIHTAVICGPEDGRSMYFRNDGIHLLSTINPTRIGPRTRLQGTKTIAMMIIIAMTTTRYPCDRKQASSVLLETSDIMILAQTSLRYSEPLS